MIKKSMTRRMRYEIERKNKLGFKHIEFEVPVGYHSRDAQ